ncbi:unnamed protein product [Sphagnum jensenii]
MAQAIYELEPIGKDGALEAVAAHFYCTTECSCRDKIDWPTSTSETFDYADGTVCETCGFELSTQAERDAVERFKARLTGRDFPQPSELQTSFDKVQEELRPVRIEQLIAECAARIDGTGAMKEAEFEALVRSLAG